MKGRLITGTLTKKIDGYRISRFSVRTKDPPPIKNPRPKIVKLAARGKLAAAEKLLKEDIECINEIDDAYLTALMWASKRGDWDMVRLLCLNDASIDYEDKGGRTALMFACREGHLDVMETLLYFGANFNQFDNEGRTPLMLAASRGKIEGVI